ncbi:Mov34/MPN/PAD-1 family protein [Paenibacillus sp. GXUN7292]|uniref:Mov34/MPN/PAD-1 family protein n=1 Tax=Paenibacillus sp. GXUN7292 TaxID=3422499 RepID=UPI003D7C8FA9
MDAQMDLFGMLGIMAEEPQSQSPKKDGKDTSVTKKNKGQKAAPSTSKAVSQKTVTKAPKRYTTPKEIREMPIPLEGWTIHYARATFQVSDVVRRLVDLDESADIETVKSALWALIPEEAKNLILEARSKAAQLPAETETASDDGDLSESTNVPAEQQEAAAEGAEEEDETELEIDEESGEVKESTSTEVEPKKDNKPEVELLDGDLIVSMVEQAMALEFFEFATPGAIEWRVFRDDKRLIPYVSNGKNSSGISSAMKRYYWKYSSFHEDQQKPAISIVAGRNGKVYDVRENAMMRVATPVRELRDLDDVPEGASFLLPKIPGQFLVQTIAFFKHMAATPLEAAVYITWDLNELRYEIHCPDQVVWTAHVEAKYPHREDKEIVCIIHSHHGWPAEFSGGDDANDKALCVYGVIGKIFNNPIQTNFRAGFNGQFYNVPVEKLFALDGVGFDESFPSEWLSKVKRA